ncbi:hypothetical protein Btru_014146 [Bulinus truncatus]|nr:hypothetical protein Btru_014146 [Bulinus truncatus]
MLQRFRTCLMYRSTFVSFTPREDLKMYFNMQTIIFIMALTYTSHSCEYDQPLHLTPYINQGNITAARNLSFVDDNHDVIPPSYAGFITVDQLLGNHLFFWFFPAINSDPNSPLVIWLNGGPGESSMTGLLHENGPLKIRKDCKGKVDYERRFKSWADNFSVLYIDNPVGAGYSYSESGDRGFKVQNDEYAEDLFEFIRQFYTMFPEYLENDLYIGGQSFAGKYVQAFGYKLHEEIQANRTNITLKGVYFSTSVLDGRMQLLKTFDLHLSLGYISNKELLDYEDGFDNYVDQLRTNGSDNTGPELLKKYGESILDNLISFDPVPDDDISAVMTSERIRSLVHVGNRTFNSLNEDVHKKFFVALFLSAADKLVELLDNYKVLIYTGDLDGVINSPTTEAVLMSSNWSLQAEYNSSKREVWKEDNVIRGFYTRVGRFCRVVIHNCGHRTSFDQPDSTLRMMDYFITDGCIKTSTT